MRYFFWLPFVCFFWTCTSPAKREKAILEKEIWILSESNPHEYFRIEFYQGHAEGMRELLREFGIIPPAQFTARVSQLTGSSAQVHIQSEASINFEFQFMHKAQDYIGIYGKDDTKMSMMAVGTNVSATPRKIFYYTEDDTILYAYLKSKKKLKLDVIWGPTQPEVMAQMFQFTKPTSSDYIFDLGCGDGRILISAAKKYGARGLGADIDPARIDAGIKLARKGNVADKVTLLNKNLFDIDISPASIVTLYLNIKTNRRLRPKLFNELKPGSQVVSHNWHMGDWQSDKQAYTSNGNRIVYYWKIPANVSGEWNGKTTNSVVHLKLKQQFQFINGEISIAGKNYKIPNIAVDGKSLQFTLEDKYYVSLVYSGDAMSGTLKTAKEIQKIEMKRKTGTQIPWPSY